MFKDLILIILGATISCAYFYFQDYRRKQKEKKQERLNDKMKIEELANKIVDKLEQSNT